MDLLELAERVEGLTGPDRDLDAEICEKAYGWKLSPVPADAKGENAGEVLTPDGQPFTVNGERWVYPPIGKIHRAYHCHPWTRDCMDPAFPRGAVRQQTAALLRSLTEINRVSDHG